LPLSPRPDEAEFELLPRFSDVPLEGGLNDFHPLRSEEDWLPALRLALLLFSLPAAVVLALGFVDPAAEVPRDSVAPGDSRPAVTDET
jgi:hypothetical protein